MSKLFSLNNLCPNQDELLGVSADREASCVICTISKKLVFIIELSQTQKKSWSTSDSFSSRVIYDLYRNQYVGIFSNIYVRLWDFNTDDINKIKRIKFNKRIKEIIQSYDNRTVVVYEDGNCESLDSALKSRKLKGEIISAAVNFTIENPQISSSGIYSFVKKKNNQKTFLYTFVDNETLTSDNPFYSIALERDGSQNIRLIGSTVITSKSNKSSLISIWNDRRIFSSELNGNNSIGFFHATIDVISMKHELCITPISDKCIIIYACNEEEDSSSLLIYNLEYKVIQSRMDFKVFIPFVKLWHAQNNIFIGLGQYLKNVPFLLNDDKLSSMIGAQRNIVDRMVDTEMITEDFIYEEALEFDEAQKPLYGMEFIPNNQHWKSQKKQLSGAKSVAGTVEVRDQLNELYRGEMTVQVIKCDDQPKDTIMSKQLSNVDEGSVLLSESIELYCISLERHGFSEIEITNKILPVLLKANRTQDIGLVLKRYNNISEQMVAMIIKYALKCPVKSVKNEMEISVLDINNVQKGEIFAGKKLNNSNAFLTTKQSETRDLLEIALCCAFDSTSILHFVSSHITLSEMILLMDYLYKTLNTDVLQDSLDIRGSLVDGDEFDIDTKLFDWFRILLDSHYQQIILSRDTHLVEKLIQWLALVDTHIGILNEMMSMRPLLLKLSENKQLELSKKCNRFYKIEKLSLH